MTPADAIALLIQSTFFSENTILTVVDCPIGDEAFQRLIEFRTDLEGLLKRAQKGEGVEPTPPEAA